MFNNPAAKWFSAGTIVRGTQLLVIVYERRGQTAIKFPGGTQKTTKGRNDQTPEETLRAEMGEEVIASGQITQANEVYVDRSNPEHTRHFFLMEFDGELRSEEAQIDREEGEADEMISPPFFLEAEELWERIFPYHRPALEAIIRRMGKKEEAWGWMARRLSIAS